MYVLLFVCLSLTFCIVVNTDVAELCCLLLVFCECSFGLNSAKFSFQKEMWK